MTASATHPVVRGVIPVPIHGGLATTLLVAALAAGAAGVWFMGIQALVLRQFCRYCTLAHLLAISVAAMAVTSAPAAISLAAPAAISAVLVGAMAVGQLILRPKTFAVVAPPAAATVPATCASLGFVKKQLVQYALTPASA